MNKRWEEHPPSWRAKHAAQGETAARWNAFFKLSPSAQKAVSQAKYAAGESVPTQKRERLEQLAVQKIMQAAQGNFRPSTIRKNVRAMKIEHIHWTIDASLQQIRRRAAQPKIVGYKTNPWWYR